MKRGILSLLLAGFAGIVFGESTGVTVNGQDVGTVLSGDGWIYEAPQLNLMGGRFLVSGNNTVENFSIGSSGNSALVISNLSIRSTGCPLEVSGNGFFGGTTLQLVGKNEFTVLNGLTPGIKITRSALLTITADSDEASLNVVTPSDSQKLSPGIGDTVQMGTLEILGGTVRVTGYPGIGAIPYDDAWAESGNYNASPLGWVNIRGGRLIATGAERAAAIGSAYSYTGTGMSVEISGGRVTAQGGLGAAGIGAGKGSNQSGDLIVISGGTVTARAGGATNAAIGPGDLGGGESYSVADPIRVTGGSLRCGTRLIKSGALDADGVPVTCVRVEGGWPDGEAVEVSGVPGSYGPNGIVSDEGCLYLWLPEGAYRLVAGVRCFEVTVPSVSWSAGSGPNAVNVLESVLIRAPLAGTVSDSTQFFFTGVLEDVAPNSTNELAFTLCERGKQDDPLWGRVASVPVDASRALTVTLADSVGWTAQSRHEKLAAALDAAGSAALQLVVKNASNKRFVVDVPAVAQAGVADRVRRGVGAFAAEGGLTAGRIESGTVEVSSGTFFARELKAKTDVKANGALRAEGRVTADGAATVSGATAVGGALTVAGGAACLQTASAETLASAKAVTNVSRVAVAKSLLVGADLVNGAVPFGTIVAWGSAAVPAGWALCDGANGTPDLRGRFPMAAGERFKAGATGGENAVALAYEQMPKHTHKVDYRYAGYGCASIEAEENYGTYKGKTKSRNTEYAGGVGTSDARSAGKAHENRPPYHALNFIMKSYPEGTK